MALIGKGRLSAFAIRRFFNLFVKINCYKLYYLALLVFYCLVTVILTVTFHGPSIVTIVLAVEKTCVSVRVAL